jgi:hypothetical protein
MMEFKVGDKVRITDSKYSGINIEPYAVVTLVEDDGAFIQRGLCGWHDMIDQDNWHYFFENGTFELIENHEPTPVGKTLQELNVQAGDVVSATDAVFSRHGNFTCTGIVEIGDYLGYRYMNSKVYPKGLFGPENGLWKIISRATIAEPSPPRKMHPDDFVSAVNDFARDNGFGVSKIEFRGCTFNDTCLPFHQYSVD